MWWTPICPTSTRSRTGRGEAYRAHVISYADDFTILSRGRAADALAWTKAVMTRLGLALNETKTAIRDARRERFDFLGYAFGPHRYRKDGHWYLGASPSKKSVLRLKAKVSDVLVPGNVGRWPEVRDRLNRLLRGWTASPGACSSRFIVLLPGAQSLRLASRLSPNNASTGSKRNLSWSLTSS
jgi:hypothetical protein